MTNINDCDNPDGPCACGAWHTPDQETYHAVEAASEDVYTCHICLSETERDFIAELLRRTKPETEFAIGTVSAASVEEAAHKISKGSWEYSQIV